MLVRPAQRGRTKVPVRHNLAPYLNAPWGGHRKKHNKKKRAHALWPPPRAKRGPSARAQPLCRPTETKPTPPIATTGRVPRAPGGDGAMH